MVLAHNLVTLVKQGREAQAKPAKPMAANAHHSSTEKPDDLQAGRGRPANPKIPDGQRRSWRDEDRGGRLCRPPRMR
jgi:hypothetical protein